MKKTVFVLLALLTLCCPANQAAAYLINTGPGPTHGGLELGYFGEKYVICASEFTIEQPAIITGIEFWMKIYYDGGLIFKIYNDGGDIPGTTTLFSLNGTIAEDRVADWKGVSGLNWSLGAGTYWVAIQTDQIVVRMPRPSASPLGNEALYANWADWEAGYEGNVWAGYDSLDIGVRIEGIIDFVPAAPLPGAVLLLGSGLMGLGLWGRFRKG